MKLERNGLFATRDTVEEAMQYADMVISAMPEAERIPAITAVYVLYNSVVNHYNKDDAYVIEFTGENIEKEFGHLYKKEEEV
jgi:hypothetical protein